MAIVLGMEDFKHHNGTNGQRRPEAQKGDSKSSFSGAVQFVFHTLD
jgi:hypothetical protein